MTTPGNSLNIKEVGFQSFDGISVFKGRTLTAGTGITITNGTGVSGDPIIGVTGSGVGQTITGNSGGALSPTLGNWNILTANSTVKFVGSGNTLTQNFNLTNLVLGSSLPSLTSGIQNVGLGSGIFGSLNTGQANVAIGFASLNAIVGGLRNTGMGAGSLQATVNNNNCTGVGYAAGANTIGEGTTAVGAFALNNCTTGGNTAVGKQCLYSITGAANCVGMGYLTLLNSTSSNDTAIGYSSGVTLTGGSGGHTFLGYQTGYNLSTGTQDILIGLSAGFNYTGSESSNIVIGNNGTTGESNTIRLGTQGAGAGQQNKAFIAGIVGVTNTNSQTVTINSTTGQMGVVSQSPGYALSMTQLEAFLSPADATTYFMSYGTPINPWTTTASNSGRIWIPKTGTITAAYGAFGVAGTTGTAQNGTVRIRVNNTTNTDITTSAAFTAALNPFSNAALSIAVTAGDYIHFQLVTPTWATNPTNVLFQCSIFIS